MMSFSLFMVPHDLNKNMYQYTYFTYFNISQVNKEKYQPPLFLHRLLELGHVLLGPRCLTDHVHQHWGEVLQGVGGPCMWGVLHYRANHIFQPS